MNARDLYRREEREQERKHLAAYDRRKASDPGLRYLADQVNERFPALEALNVDDGLVRALETVIAAVEAQCFCAGQELERADVIQMLVEMLGASEQRIQADKTAMLRIAARRSKGEKSA
jgi:hypothetical protein